MELTQSDIARIMPRCDTCIYWSTEEQTDEDSDGIPARILASGYSDRTPDDREWEAPTPADYGRALAIANKGA